MSAAPATRARSDGAEAGSAQERATRHGSRRWQGPAALALFAGLPCLLASLTVSNGLRWLDARAAQEADAQRLAQMEQRIRGTAAAKMPRLDTAAIYLDAPSAGLARAALQTRIAGLVDRAGGRLVEVRAEDEAPGAESRGVLVRFTFDTVHARLVELLTTIETGLPLLTIEALAIRIAPDRTADASEADPNLRVSLAVRGFRREARP